MVLDFVRQLTKNQLAQLRTDTCVVGWFTNIKVYRDGSLIATTPHPDKRQNSWLIQLGNMDIQLFRWWNG